MARLSVTLAAVCCASFLGISGSLAQDLGGRATHPIEGGPIDIPQLTRRADLVVHGFVTTTTTAWIGRVLYTLYDVSVQETLKGAPRTRVVVAVAGGARGNVRLTVPGAPDVQPGEQLVVFATTLQGPTFTPVGTFDGLVRVRQGNGGSSPTVSPRGRPESLDAFLDEVRRQGGR